MGIDKYVKPFQVAYWIGSRCCVLASDPKADKLVKIARPHTMEVDVEQLLCSTLLVPKEVEGLEQLHLYWSSTE